MKSLSKFFLLLFFITTLGCTIGKSPNPTEYAYDIFGIDLVKGKQLYLAYNIWYTDSTNISPLNYHTGTIIPFGTPVDIVRAEEGLVVFQLKGGIRQFRIKNDMNLTMLKDKEFYNHIFTPKNPEAKFSNLDELTLADMKKGIVKPNMTREQVLAVFGPPPKFMNPLSDVTWSYYVNSQFKTTHVVFKNDKVSYVFDN